MKALKELKVKIFADGADKASMLEMHANPLIKGLTTNPTLMRKAGVSSDVTQKRTKRPLGEMVADISKGGSIRSDCFDFSAHRVRVILCPFGS